MRLQVRWIKGWAYAYGTGPDGARIRRALKTQDDRRAEEARAHLEARLWKVSHYGPEAVVTFDEAALAYAEDGGEARFLVKVTEKLTGKLLREITPKMIRDAARRAYPQASAATVNRQGITPAQAVVNYAHAQGWCGLIRVERLAVEQSKRKAVGADYIAALRPHLPLRAFALMAFLHMTGRRVGDAVRLKPEDRDGTLITIDRTKNGEAATAIISDEMAQMLDSIPPRHGLLFGYVHRSGLYGTLRRAATKAGVEYLGTHQPGRHSFATHLSDLGWGSKAIAEAGGWKSPQLVAKIYEHPTNAQGRAAKITGKKMAKAISSASATSGKKRGKSK